MQKQLKDKIREEDKAFLRNCKDDRCHESLDRPLPAG